MKSSISFFSIILLCSMISCEQNLFFTSPMPPKEKTIKAIPDEWTGIFSWELDESYLVLLPSCIIKEEWYTTTISRTKISENESCNIRDGGIYHDDWEECIPFEYLDEDSIRATIIETDTIFQFTDSQKMKFRDDKLFLNFKNEEGLWLTHVLQAHMDGTLTWEILEVGDEDSLESIVENYETKILKDSSKIYILNPTTQEFKSILNLNSERRFFKFYPINIEEEYPKVYY